MIIADTGPLVAIANDRDQQHQACLSLLGCHRGPVLVPAPGNSLAEGSAVSHIAMPHILGH